MTVLITTSVVRGSHQGESHGGVFLVDVDNEQVVKTIDWNTVNIDWQGRGWDRGLRGIAFDAETVYIAASDELFAYTPGFERIASYRNPFLKHCHEIVRHERRLYLTSTGFDSILAFDLDSHRFTWGLRIERLDEGFQGQPFNPDSGSGPMPGNLLHINNVYCNESGMYVSGLRTGAVLQFNGRMISEWCSLPHGAHNARPHRDGVLFNDTQSDVVRYAAPGCDRVFNVPRYEPARLTHTDLDDSRIARQAFGRGLCTLDGGQFAAGSSPSTIAVHDLDLLKTVKIITLSLDIRNGIHGLAVWPFALP